MHWTTDEFLRTHADLLCCPACGGAPVGTDEGFQCPDCGRGYPEQDDIPSFFVPNDWGKQSRDVTDDIKAFYEANPFPNYDEFDSAASLLDKARSGLFARLLDEQIPFGARVIECGCGTGQLTNFLAVANRTVIGVDLCLNSLKLATAFKHQNALDRAHFLQMNLFRPCFSPASFDLVISNGVLHHTADPFRGLQSIARLVKPGGYLLVGLYHRYGRLATDLRRWVFNATNDRFMFLDRHAVDPRVSAAKRRSWFMDQYKNPHESKHTVGEVLGWLDRIGFQFVHAIPKTVPFSELEDNERLFRPERIGSPVERLVVNLGMILAGHREGGFFITIARRPISDQ
jgi:SAM-dependent methyltransferase